MFFLFFFGSDWSVFFHLPLPLVILAYSPHEERRKERVFPFPLGTVEDGEGSFLLLFFPFDSNQIEDLPFGLRWRAAPCSVVVILLPIFPSFRGDDVVTARYFFPFPVGEQGGKRLSFFFLSRIIFLDRHDPFPPPSPIGLYEPRRPVPFSIQACGSPMTLSPLKTPSSFFPLSSSGACLKLQEVNLPLSPLFT